MTFLYSYIFSWSVRSIKIYRDRLSFFGKIYAVLNVNKLMSVFYASVLLLIMNFVMTLSKQLWMPSGSADFFDNVMTKFIVNNRTDALKADIDLFFFITNC